MLAVIAAMDEEIKLIKTAAKNKKEFCVCGIDCFTCTLENTEAVVLKSGIGKVSAASAAAVAIAVFKADEVINTGLAAGVYGFGTVMLADKVVQYDFDMRADGYELGRNPDFESAYFECDAALTARLKASLNKNGTKFVTASIASGDAFVADKAKMDFICSAFKVGGVEMESAAVGQVCTRAAVPFAILRAVSDGGDNVADFYTFMKDGCKNFTDAVLNFCKS